MVGANHACIKTAYMNGSVGSSTSNHSY